MLGATELLDRALAGDRRALARAISLIERGDRALCAGLGRLRVRRRDGPGAPHVVGLTGPPGAGKSTLADAWIAETRAVGLRIAVVAVDPSSPFSGGAILGDRIRMERHTGDPGVFVRSLSARGRVGGLSAACAELIDLLDAAGFDRILVETVGVGQSELAVMEVADTVVVLLTPESGDTVQTMKAGLLEVASVFAVNKADRPGAESLVRLLAQAVALDAGVGWVPPVLRAVSSNGEGVPDLLAAASAHLAWCVAAGRPDWDARRAEGRVRQFLDLVADEARAGARRALVGELGADLRAGRLDPRAATRIWTSS